MAPVWADDNGRLLQQFLQYRVSRTKCILINGFLEFLTFFSVGYRRTHTDLLFYCYRYWVPLWNGENQNEEWWKRRKKIDERKTKKSKLRTFPRFEFLRFDCHRFESLARAWALHLFSSPLSGAEVIFIKYIYWFVLSANNSFWNGQV